MHAASQELTAFHCLRQLEHTFDKLNLDSPCSCVMVDLRTLWRVTRTMHRWPAPALLVPPNRAVRYFESLLVLAIKEFSAVNSLVYCEVNCAS